jgi:hypothetical protein
MKKLSLIAEAAKVIAFENKLVGKIRRLINHYLVEKFLTDQAINNAI